MDKLETLDKSYFESVTKERVVSLEVGPGSKAGDNVAGCLKCVQMKTGCGKIRDFVVKLLPELPAQQGGMLQMRMMEHEVNIYRDLLPGLQSFLSKHGLSSSDYLPFPGYIGGGIRWLVLEDLRPSGFQMADKYSGLDFAHVSLVMRHLARFHASGYAYIRYRGTQIFEEFSTKLNFTFFSWFPPQMDPKHKIHLVNVFSRLNSIIRDKHSEAIAAKMDKFIPNLLELFEATHLKTDKDYFGTIVLADVWVNNIMFRYGVDEQAGGEGQSTAGQRIPDELNFLDLQQVKRGNIFEDLEYFFATSTTPEFREKFLVPSLRIYYEEFESTLKILECPMPLGFSFGFLVENYYKNLLQVGVFIGMAIAFQLGNFLAAAEEARTVEGTDEAVKAGETTSKRNDCVELTPLPEEMFPLGSHFSVLEHLCYRAILAEPRALQRFIDVVDELDKLQVFD